MSFIQDFLRFLLLHWFVMVALTVTEPPKQSLERFEIEDFEDLINFNSYFLSKFGKWIILKLLTQKLSLSKILFIIPHYHSACSVLLGPKPMSLIKVSLQEHFNSPKEVCKKLKMPKPRSNYKIVNGLDFLSDPLTNKNKSIDPALRYVIVIFHCLGKIRMSADRYL